MVFDGNGYAASVNECTKSCAADCRGLSEQNGKPCADARSEGRRAFPRFISENPDPGYAGDEQSVATNELDFWNEIAVRLGKQILMVAAHQIGRPCYQKEQ